MIFGKTANVPRVIFIVLFFAYAQLGVTMYYQGKHDARTEDMEKVNGIISSYKCGIM